MIKSYNQYIKEDLGFELEDTSLLKGAEKCVDILCKFPEATDNIIDNSDLNDALIDLQEMIGQDDGGVAGMYFSKYDDPEDFWEKATREDRLAILRDYLDVEDSYTRVSYDGRFIT